MSAGNGRSAEAAHLRLDGHERECAVRYQGIQSAIDELKADIGWILKGVIAVLLAIVGGLAMQVYDGVKAPALAAEKQAAVAAGTDR